MKQINEAKKDDVLIQVSFFAKDVVKVQEVTDCKIILENSNDVFKLIDGNEANFNSSRVRFPKRGELKKIQEADSRKKLVEKISNTKFFRFSMPHLELIQEAIDRVLE